MEAIFMNMENSKTNEPHKCILNLSQRSDLKSVDKHDAPQNLCIYYTSKNMRKQYKGKKLKIIAPTWNGEFELPDGSNSDLDIQDYIEYNINKHETFTAIPPIHVYINRINNRLVFKIKAGYKLELQMPETMKLFGSTEKSIDKKTEESTKSWSSWSNFSPM